ncbi:MAG: serine/threonine protein kinase [Candidatus Bathyarchaeota archaeon]|nr:serine/threonine protein kinase [Candidatus Bathyarchaeota archaeon]
MNRPVVVPVEQLVQEPYASVLCFPKLETLELQNRIKELANLHVSALEFSGKASIFGVSVPVLGKGFVGIVVVAYLNGARVALKIRRLDADRPDLLHEAKMLSKANSVSVAPKLVTASKNFLLMQLIDGEILPNWLKTPRRKAEVKQVLRDVLKQCFRLDEGGVDHGELSKAPKHVIIDQQQKPFLLDFETASDTRKPANVSALSSFLFTSQSETARLIADVLGERNKDAIVVALKNYKKSRSKESFEGVLKACLT